MLELDSGFSVSMIRAECGGLEVGRFGRSYDSNVEHKGYIYIQRGGEMFSRLVSFHRDKVDGHSV